MAKTKTTAPKKRKRRRGGARRAHRRGGRRRHGGGGINMLHLGLATAALGYATSASGPEFIRTNAAKIPGAATFGTAAAIGVAGLAFDRFVKPNKWAKLLGVAGVVLAAAKIGEQGKDFKFLGDGDTTADVGDDDVGDDDVADLDMGDDDDDED